MSMKRIERGKPIEELVKGSVEYTLGLIANAFRQQFPYLAGHDYYIMETFADSVIVREYGSQELKPDEYYQVSYSREGEIYTFAAREAWETVELAYQPQSAVFQDEAQQGEKKGERRLVEQLGGVRLLEAEDGKPRKIRAIGITADVVNGNGRRYPAGVLQAAVADVQGRLGGSPGQGRLVQLLGEAEHPSAKGGRPNILETVFKWEAISFNGSTGQVELEGIILPTSKGRDIQALLENGVMLPLSQRAYGQSRTIKENNQAIEEITALRITGYDAVMEPSDPVAQITESKEEKIMDPEEFKKMLLEMLQKNPELVKGLFQGDLNQMSEAQLKAVEGQARKALGIGENDDLAKALNEAAQAKRTLDTQAAQRVAEEAIADACKDLKYGEKLNKLFEAALRNAHMYRVISNLPLLTADEVKKLAEDKRKEYDQIAASLALQEMGFKKPAAGIGVQMLGPVFESETGYPEHARAAYELQEMIRKQTFGPKRDFRKPRTINEQFTAQYLEAYDKAYGPKLRVESRLFNEAEQTSDLDLPYSVMRAVVAEAYPTLVASGLFDVQMSGENPAHLYFETYTGETGYTVAAAAEAVVADLDDWVALTYKRITPGTLVAKDHAEAVTYVEGTDYVIDYANGQFMALTAGAILNGGDVHITAYTYTAIRKGEMAPIERGKMTLTHEILTMAADRLATEISREAVVFSRSQMNYDATARTLASLVRQIQRKIDQGIMYLGLSAALSVASNSGGTWSKAGLISDFVEKAGVAKGKVAYRYYTPSFMLLSYANADLIANWDGFTQAGSRPDADLNAEGFIGRLKGLAVFSSTEFSENYALIGNRELVLHRIGQPMQLFGPFPSYEAATGKLIAANQYYAEEFNGDAAPVPGKGSTVKITA